MKYSSQGKQLTIEDFRSSLSGLSKSNRWVKLGDLLPWEAIEKVYHTKLNNGRTGAGNKPARIVVGSLIIKHKMNLSDEETIAAIQENPYMQYMLGLSEFSDKPVFDSSLFVTIRKRLQVEDLNALTHSLLTLKESDQQDDDSTDDNDDDFIDSQGRVHKGDMKIDATCCDGEVRYPTDLDLLNDGSRLINRYITKLCRKFSLNQPVSFKDQCRKAYLEAIKRKRKSKKMVNDCKSHMLTYLIRDIRSLIELIAVHGTQLLDGLRKCEQKIMCAIINMYHQQDQMFKAGVHSCTDRIISIFQPHLRPIVRGKSKAPTEFGAKIGVSLGEGGYTFVDHHSWDAYNEASDLRLQIELYRQRFGCLPTRIYADKIYMNRDNRQLMKDLGIQAMGKPLGRPPKKTDKEHEDRMTKSVSQRNAVEATFGTAKRVYRANNIRAKLPQTANCWTGMCYFVKNVMKFLKELLYALLLITGLPKIQRFIFCKYKYRIEIGAVKF
jgi:hypothetical protein